VALAAFSLAVLGLVEISQAHRLDEVVAVLEAWLDAQERIHETRGCLCRLVILLVPGSIAGAAEPELQRRDALAADQRGDDRALPKERILLVDDHARPRLAASVGVQPLQASEPVTHTQPTSSAPRPRPAAPLTTARCALASPQVVAPRRSL
jgi:hypothetical protein